MNRNETYFNGPCFSDDFQSDLDVIHVAGNAFNNKKSYFPVIIGYFTEDDDGNLEYTYYEKYDTKGIG